MKIVIINGSARKGNTLTAINAFIKGASEKNEIEIIEHRKGLTPRCRLYQREYRHLKELRRWRSNYYGREKN